MDLQSQVLLISSICAVASVLFGIIGIYKYCK